MAKIKIETQTRNLDEKRRLLEILANSQVYANNITEARDGYNIHITKQEEIDIVFETQCQQSLQAAGYSTVLPIELKAKKIHRAIQLQ